MDAEALHAHVVDGYTDHLNPNLSKLMAFAGFGLEDHAEGCYIFDHEGNKYLDCLGGYGVFSLGHRHPKVVEAVQNQLGRMPLSSKVFFSPQQAELAIKLAQLSPAGLQYTFFSNSGTEAVEAALKMARITTSRTRFVSTEDSYHGKTLGALSVTGREKYRAPFEPLIPGASFVPFGDLAAAEAAVCEETAAMIIEVVQGEGGINVAPPGYIAGLRKRCDQMGALLIVDEVQTGLGRTGKLFACEHDGVKPDIMTLAKCLGGGVMPIGATMGTEAVWSAVYGKNPLVHTSTFGGNPLASVAGLAALQVIEDDGLVERSATLGAMMKAKLMEVAKRHPDSIREVRGLGLMIGVEFSMDEMGELTIAQMTKRGMVAAYTLNNPRVIRMEPPLIITEEQIDFAVRTFEEALAETEEMVAELD